MLKSENEVEELRTWCNDLIDEFRIEFEKLDSIEQSQISNTCDYRSPCQIEIFWVSEPYEYQLFLTLHNTSIPDKEIHIHGPYAAIELNERVFKIVEEPRWRMRAPYPHISDFSESFVDVSNKGRKYSDFFVNIYDHFLKFLGHPQLASLGNTGIRSGTILGNRDWAYIIGGNLAHLKPSLVANSMREAKQRAQEIRDGNTGVQQNIQQEVQQNDLIKQFGSYYFPGVRIGDDVELSFKEKLYGPNCLDYPKYEYEFKLSGRMGFFDTYGFVILHSETKKEGIELLNTIFAISLMHGVPVLSTREYDITETEIEPSESVLGRPVGSLSWHTTRNGRFTPTNFIGPRQTVISLDIMYEIIHQADRALHDKQLNKCLNLLLESHTHLYSAECSQSFLFSWLIAEKEISNLFTLLLKENRVTGERKKKFNSHNMWSIDRKIEVLNLTEKISEDDYDLLNECNTKRNNFVHKGDPITETDARKLYDFVFKRLKQEIANVIVG